MHRADPGFRQDDRIQENENMGLLSLAIWLPIVAGVVLLALGRDDQAVSVRRIALVAATISFLVTLPLIGGFDAGTAAMQFQEKAVWIARFNVRYHLGVDGLSLWFVPLTAFITVIVVISAWEVITQRVNQYMGAFLILSGLMIGVFCALDGLLFYVFFEATLIPMYIIIGVWGGPNRVYAAFKFFLYTLAGSLLMLIALIYLYYKSGGSFDILTWHKLPLPGGAQSLLFFAFLLAFAVKVPMWPVHTWLPDAHVEAPTGGSVVLAAIMLKLGGYGFLRFSLPITPDATHQWAWLIIALSLIAVIYIGLVALVQQDMKKLVAYSSIAHMGFVTLGFFIFDAAGKGNELAVSGGIVQMVSHAFISGAMFLCIGVLYDRVHSRDIAAYGGVVNSMPKFATFAVLFAMANCGLPGTSGFVGEWMVILGVIKVNFWLAALAATTLVFGAAYTLWMVKRVYFGAVANDDVKALRDINPREFVMLGLLAIAVLWMGLYPKPFTDAMHVSVIELLKHVAVSKLN
jgi:NADH-quinone oxidoreductase subunit M